MSNLKYNTKSTPSTTTTSSSSNTPIWCYLSQPSQIARKYASIAPIWCHISRPRQLKKKFASTFQHAQNLLTRQHSKDSVNRNSTGNLNHNSNRHDGIDEDDIDNDDETTINNTIANENLTNNYDNNTKSWNQHHYNEPLMEKSTNHNNSKKYTTSYDNYSTNNSTSNSTSVPSKYNYLLRRDSSIDSKIAKSASSNNLHNNTNGKPIDTTSSTSSSSVTTPSGANNIRSWYTTSNSNNDSSNKYLNKNYYNDSLNDTPAHSTSSSSYLYDANVGSENAKRVLHKYAHRTSGAKTERLNSKASKSSPSRAYNNENDADQGNSSSKWLSTANTSTSSALSINNPFTHSNQTNTTTTSSNSYYHPSSSSSTTYYPYYHHYSHYHLPTSTTTSSSTSTTNSNSYYSYPSLSSSSSSYYPSSTSAITTAPSLSISSTREHKWNELDSMLGAQSALLNRLESDFVANRTKLKAAVNISSPLITSSSSNLSLTSTTVNLPTTTTTSYSRPSNMTSIPDYPQTTADFLISKYTSNRYVPSAAATSTPVTSNSKVNSENNEILTSSTTTTIQPIPENILESGKIRKVLKYTSGKTTKTGGLITDINSNSDSAEISLKKYNYTEPLHEIIKELNLNTTTSAANQNNDNSFDENEVHIEENLVNTNNCSINNIEPEISGIKYTTDDFVPQVLPVSNKMYEIFFLLRQYQTNLIYLFI